MRKRGRKNWNGEPVLLGLRIKSDTRIARKLEDVCQSLTLLAEQGEVMGFLTNPENAQRINSLVDDIHEALMDYQVCLLNCLFLSYLMFALNFIATGYLQQELSMYCESPPLSILSSWVDPWTGISRPLSGRTSVVT